jgi:hypothetical protein
LKATGGTFVDVLAPTLSVDSESPFLTGELSVSFRGAEKEDDAIVPPLHYGDITLTREPINVKATENAIVVLGSLKVVGMDTYNSHDEGRTIASILRGFLDRVVARDPFDENIGWIYSAFKESAYAKSEHMTARLFTGCRLDQLPPLQGSLRVAP